MYMYIIHIYIYIYILFMYTYTYTHEPAIIFRASYGRDIHKFGSSSKETGQRHEAPNIHTFMCIHSHIAYPQAKEAQQRSTNTLHSYVCTFANCHQHVAGIVTHTRVYICVSYMHRLQLARC